MPDLSRDEDGFTEMQRRFLFYYLRDPEESRAAGDPVTYGNATQSAIEAGYSEHTAHSIGHELKNKPHIREAIDQHHAKRRTEARERRQAQAGAFG
jgi:phage terminase small subunit